jgi:hypothetical protein
MNAALACLCEAVSTLPNPPANCCFRVGTEAIADAGVFEDQCCQGIAYVMLGDMYPASDAFPIQDTTRQAASNCPPLTWALYLKMGIIRCVPVGDQDPLHCNDWNAMAVQNVYDNFALARASCCLRNWVNTESTNLVGMSVVIDRITQGGIQGGCIERSLPIAVQIPNFECLCP